MIKKLIVNADDFGLSEGVCLGILKAHRDGILTSTTCMMNMENIEKYLEMTKAYPNLGLGVHLNITVGKPLTKVSFIDEKGNYLGGAVAPGIGISMEALFQRASKLPRIELVKTSSVICKNTVSAMQAGIYYGFVGQIDEIVKRIKMEMKRDDIKVIATGGLASLFSKASAQIDVVDPMLTLKGLLILYEKNKNDRKPCKIEDA